MTPARLAEIRAYIQRLDLDQLPGWTDEQRIIADLFEELPEAWEEGVVTALNHAFRNDDGITLRLEHLDGRPWANPYRDGEQQ